jgi:hypothetical protein
MIFSCVKTRWTQTGIQSSIHEKATISSKKINMMVTENVVTIHGMFNVAGHCFIEEKLLHENKITQTRTL